MVANKLTNDLSFQLSLSDQLHSDQDKQFDQVHLISEVTSPGPLPPLTGDGLVEQFNKILLDMLSTTIKDYQGNW